MSDALLALVPLAFLVVSLLLGHYPAERALHRGRGRHSVAKRPANLSIPDRAATLGPRLPRGPALLGVALAGRAPPALAQRAGA